ncbi:MAG: hypothetical protein QOD69_996 [Solirubrobacteraceae bacterium]|nr:hypothetical protein [Solirubrobacteraceae bacterium]
MAVHVAHRGRHVDGHGDQEDGDGGGGRPPDSRCDDRESDEQPAGDCAREYSPGAAFGEPLGRSHHDTASHGQASRATFVAISSSAADRAPGAQRSGQSGERRAARRGMVHGVCSTSSWVSLSWFAGRAAAADPRRTKSLAGRAGRRQRPGRRRRSAAPLPADSALTFPSASGWPWTNDAPQTLPRTRSGPPVAARVSPVCHRRKRMLDTSVGQEAENPGGCGASCEG